MMISPGEPTIDPRDGDEAAHRRFCLRFALMAGGLLVAVALFNATIDPYRALHAAWFPLAFPSNARMLNAGLAKHEQYDAIILGTSHCDNFLPSTIQRELGWNALRLTIPGATLPEQLVVLETALSTGKPRHVLWGLDLFAFQQSPELSTSNRGAFPLGAYRPTWGDHARYLLSADTSREAVKSLASRKHRDLETRGVWSNDFVYSEAAALKATRRALHDGAMANLFEARVDVESIERNLQAVERVIEEHADVEFVCILPPISALGYLADFREANPAFTARLQFRAQVSSRLGDRSNVRLYDFETAFEVTHNLHQYKDATHYSGAINDWMIEEIAADRWRATSKNSAERNDRWSAATLQFVRETHDPRSPRYAALQLNRGRWLRPDDVLRMAVERVETIR